MEISNKIVLISVIALVSIFVVSALIGGTITGEATNPRRGGGGGGGSGCTDKDSDRFFTTSGCSAQIDCNDNNPNINPGSPEVCGNNIDDDCSNGDIGLCNANIYIKTTKESYTEIEGVRLE